MKIGVFLHDHFYRKHCGKPMHGLEPKGWFVLNIEEACRATPVILGDLKSMGVECVEIGGSLGRLEKLAAVLKDREDIEIILHTEGDPFIDRCTSENLNTRQAAVANLKRNIDVAREIEARAITLHHPQYRASSIEAIRECFAYAQAKDITIALENCGYGNEGIKAIKKFLSAPGLENLQCVFDSGHANIGGDASKCAGTLGGAITHVHWHDNNGKKDQHLGPGMGTINFAALMKTLLAIESRSGKEITITLECDKPEVNYEKAFRETVELRDNILGRKSS